MITEGLSLQRDDHVGLSSGKPAISKLPVEILLWIFDFYRQGFWHQSTSKSGREWYSRNWWFRLVHVCRTWRCIVLSSPSRLRLQLYLTHLTRASPTVLIGPSLPPLPIAVDYYNVDWEDGSQDRLLSTLRSYPGRLRRIAIEIASSNSNDISKALDGYFPFLESLELRCTYSREFDLPHTFLATSLKSLRHLKITSAKLASLPPLLSATTELLDLTLGVDPAIIQDSSVSLLALLKYLPRLHRLSLIVVTPSCTPSARAVQVPPVKTKDVVSLAELTYFYFRGHPVPIEAVVVGLAAPLLRELDISLYHNNDTADMPHLSKFIRNAGMIFHAAQFKLTLTICNIFLLKHSHFDDPHFNIIGNEPTSIPRICNALSMIFDTVEDIVLAFFWPYSGPFRVDLARWRGFLGALRNLKILRVQHGIEKEVANMIRQGHDPITVTDILAIPEGEVDFEGTIPPDMSINSSQCTLGFLPSLEGIEIYTKSATMPISESERASALEPFDAFVAARLQAGRPVKVYWNTDRLFPESYWGGREWETYY